METGRALEPPVLPARPGEIEASLAELAALAADAVGLAGARILRAGHDDADDDLVALPLPVGADPLVVADATADPRTADLPAVVAGRVGAYVAVPVLGPRGAVRAVLQVHGPRPRSLPADAVRRLTRFASLVSTGIDTMEQYDDLESDRQRWELAVSAGGVGSFDWDLVTDRLDWDDRLMELFGYLDEEWVPHIDSFTARLHPEDVAPTEAIIAEAIAVSGRYRAEYRVVWPDGTVRWVAARGQVARDVDGRPVRMLGVAFDVTEAHQAASLVRRTRDRLEVLAAVSNALSGTTDARGALARLPAVIVPRLADFAIVSVIQDDGSVLDVGSHHQDPARTEALATYCAHRHDGLDGSAWAVRSRHTGRMVTVPYPAWENVLPLLGNEIAREKLIELRPAFVLIVPLRIRGEVVGLLSLMGNRVVAFIIDYVILNVFSLVAIIILFTGVIASTGTLDCRTIYDANGVPTDYTCDNAAGASAGAIITFVIFLILWIGVLVAWVWMLGTKGQTPGKKWMGVKVVDNDSGQPIGFGRALLRYIVQYLANIVCYAGLWSAWLDGPPEGRYRGWHDKAVNSVVISVK